MQVLNPAKPARKRQPPSLLPLVVLCALTWLLGLVDTAPTSVSPPLLNTTPTAWRAVGQPKNLTFDSGGVTVSRIADGRSRAEQLIDLPGGERRRIRIHYSLETVAPPDPDLDASVAFLSLLFLDEHGKRVGLKSIGQASRKRYVLDDIATIVVPETATAATFIFGNRDTTSGGIYRLLKLQAVLVDADTVQLAIAFMLAAAWALLTISSVHLLYRRLDRWMLTGIAAAVGFVSMGVMLPEGPRSMVANTWRSIIEHVPLLTDIHIVDVFKAGHFAAFLVLGILLFRLRARLGLSQMRTAVLLALLAIASEGAQLHLDGRTARPTDILIDGAGIIIAALVAGGRSKRRSF